MTPREQEILRRTELSETRVTKAVFPPTTNHHNTLFGGTALAWMDEVRSSPRPVSAACRW